MASYNGRMHYNLEQNSWYSQPSTQRRIIRVKISGTFFLLALASDGRILLAGSTVFAADILQK